MLRRIGSVVLVVLALSAVLVRADAPKPKMRWLHFLPVEYTATLDGQAVDDLQVYAGRNKEKLLYALVLTRPVDATVCVEVTTGFIGRFAADDLRTEEGVMHVKSTAVPPAERELTLAVDKGKRGYTLTIAQDKTRLVVNVPPPPDAYDVLLRVPPEDVESPMIHRAIELWEAKEASLDESLPAPPGRSEQCPRTGRRGRSASRGVPRERETVAGTGHQRPARAEQSPLDPG